MLPWQKLSMNAKWKSIKRNWNSNKKRAAYDIL